MTNKASIVAEHIPPALDKIMNAITVNGIEFDLDLRSGKERQQIRELVESEGIDWKSAEVFVPNYPERGRALKKSAGFEQLGAHG